MDEIKNEQAPSPTDERDAAENYTAAILSYIWILFLIPLLAKRNSKFCQFHAKQGLILFIASLVCWFPFFGWVIGLLVILFSVIGIIKTYNKEWWKAPFIYELSEKIKI
jgi:uncharacterized membrane protein